MDRNLNNFTNPLNRSIKRGFKDGLRLAVPVLALLVAIGCYRATGYDRAALIAQEIPTVGGDRIPGVKSMAGAGDYYVGNDFVALTVDGSPLSERSGIAGAPGGGSIVDVGYIELDTSYRRVHMPCDTLDRMTTVVNQDPDITLVFDDFRAVNEIELSRLEMYGRIHDPKHKLAEATWDSHGFVADVAAVTRISLTTLDRRFHIETTITNNRSSAIDVRNIGDLLYQRGGGFRIIAAANENASGAPLSTWGVDIPGTDFSNPLLSSVRSGPVAFMGNEPGANTVDCHITLGLMPLDSEQFLVASDPQNSLAETRPIFPERFVAGSLDTGAPLEPNASLTHRRRLFLKGGSSGTPDYQVYLFTQNTPNQATGILNDMINELLSLNDKKAGLLRFFLEGSATRTGPVPAELRFERYVGEGDPTTDQEPDHWRLERLEWMEPPENSDASSEYLFTPNAAFGVFLPEGTYRIISKNRFQSTTLQAGTDSNNEDRPNLRAPITLESEKTYNLLERLSPERDDVLSPYGSRIASAQSIYYITTRGNDSYSGFVQPMRFTITGLEEGIPDPLSRRNRAIKSIFDPTARLPRPTVGLPGWFHFMGGNSAFGVQIADGLSVWTPTDPGLYRVYGARGPLSSLESFVLDSRPGLGTTYNNVTVFQAPLPEGWIAFDTPGPTQTTSGGMLPSEQLASALADGVDVVARTEMDHHSDANALYDEFTIDLAYEESYVTAINGRPFVVGARSSNLESYGTVTAYFTPVDVESRNGGARPSDDWSLADFLLQAEGKYNVIHRPRGPLGIFTQLGFDPALPLNQAAPWWHETGLISYGKINGEFDALEIINAGTIASSGVDVWWSEFKSVRRDWFALLSQQRPDSFTKALGFSSGRFSENTPVGLARTYLYIGETELTQPELDPVLAALKSGAAVASSGPMLDVKVGEAGPGALAAINVSPSSITLNITLVAPDWLPVDELRVVVNGQTVAVVVDPKSELTRSTTDSRFYSGTIDVPVPVGADGWLVVEAGAPLDASGAYRPRSPWNAVMKGIYPVAITNPIFLDLNGGGYTPPGLSGL